MRRPIPGGGAMDIRELNDREFSLFQKLIHETAGISMSSAKRSLVSGRLAKRLRHLGLKSYSEYYRLLDGAAGGEMQTAVDLLTTNETSFFRESKHFDFLRDRVLPEWRGGFRRLWSAACSSGEEAYTLAMQMAEHSPTDTWEIVGTDISARVVERARTGEYPMERAAAIPRPFLSKYCRKGIGSKQGSFIVASDLRGRTRFVHANLTTDLSGLGKFDAIFLRNVLIYFDQATKQRVVSLLLRQLASGGYFIVGHSESLNGLTDGLQAMAPSVYRKP